MHWPEAGGAAAVAADVEGEAAVVVSAAEAEEAAELAEGTEAARGRRPSIAARR